MSEADESDRFVLQALALVGGPLAGGAAGLAMLAAGWPADAAWAVVITSWVVIWWIFEPIPIPATSLLPLALMPLLGVIPQGEVASAYGSPLILLLLGGFILSTAMERSGAHRRVALSMVRLFGGNSGRQLVFGFMAAAAVLSMWISNTATTLMLLPVALAVLERAEDRRLATPLLLGIAYAASLGGVGTPIGTPPNLIFMQVYRETTGTEISFLEWMSWGVPVVIVFIPLMALWLTRGLAGSGRVVVPDVGPWRTEEARVLGVFGLTALAWITRREPFGGWSDWFGLPGANDASVAFVAVVAMFLIPNGRGGRLLNWESAERIPWGMLLLFAGGITIAKAFEATGISVALGAVLSGLATWPLLLVIAIICLAITFLTEMTSNTATTTLMMPILAAAAVGAGIEPTMLMVPAAMSASCAFMLPVATAPNAIMFGTGRFTTRVMAREGLALNLIGVVVISVTIYLLV
ncbi:MAG TPA: SLC13 family permease [Pseudomonadales bacterium]|nr:SLC13 family permease [Pseudomonadales bacterium]